MTILRKIVRSERSKLAVVRKKNCTIKLQLLFFFFSSVGNKLLYKILYTSNVIYQSALIIDIIASQLKSLHSYLDFWEIFSTSWIAVVSIFSRFLSVPHSLFGFLFLGWQKECAGFMVSMWDGWPVWGTAGWPHGGGVWGTGRETVKKSQIGSQNLALRSLEIMQQCASLHSSAPV